jgi:CheY-like chemotaxis protein/anti-sigma regulatory factor (Ser/Thr protein kinase)
VSTPDESIHVVADVTRLSQVFANLLHNAAKCTRRGGRIELTVRRQHADVLVSVTDNGVGIPAHQLSGIFEVFTQAGREDDDAGGGLGIGLNIVKRLVEMHGGTVEARSEGHGMGSEFMVCLPVAADDTARENRPASSPSFSDAVSGRRILVADDNVDAASSLAVLLKVMGHDVRTAHNGAEAVEVAEVFRPEFVLLDLGMPRVSGYDACRSLRQSRWGNDMAIVALTGWGQAGDKRQSADAGFDHHLVKPVEPAALERLLAGTPASRMA